MFTKKTVLYRQSNVLYKTQEELPPGSVVGDRDVSSFRLNSSGQMETGIAR